jgi:A/G-specific adenine glycosylase
MSLLSNHLINWHKQSGRKNLPWQVKTNPYKVWISEIMLQQTQVKTVIPYFLKFVERYPNINSLANSDEDEVLSYWSGLGYYSRGRNLLKSAKILKKDFNSVMPDTSEELQLLPGIGKSTAGAILSLGFGIKAPILDGNAKRVLVRYYNINDPVDLTSTVNQLWEIAENNLPENECDVYTQAIMDVGALICKRSNPLCSKCPLIETCVSKKENKHNLLPIRSPKKEKPVKKLYWLILQNEEGEILLENKKNKGVWEGLWTFLGFKEEDSRREYIEQLNENYTVIMKDKRIKHSFTHYKLDIDLQHIRMHGKIQNLDNNKVWFNNNGIMKVGLPSPVAKELERIKKNDSNSFLQKI